MSIEMAVYAQEFRAYVETGYFLATTVIAVVLSLVGAWVLE